MSTPKNYAAHCDKEIRFYATESEAMDFANSEIEVSREDSRKGDGWDEETTEGIVVMQVIHRAVKVDPNIDYRCVDYHLVEVGEQRAKNAARIAELEAELKLWRPLTNEEAEAALAEAKAEPFSDEQIDRIMAKVLNPTERMTNYEEAQLEVRLEKAQEKIVELEAACAEEKRGRQAATSLLNNEIDERNKRNKRNDELTTLRELAAEVKLSDDRMEDEWRAWSRSWAARLKAIETKP